jgi:serine/threonine-protein kinase RsbW
MRGVTNDVAPLSRPPAGPVIHRWVLDNAQQLRDLRAELHTAITGDALSDDEKLGDVAEQMVLVATELATNALRHGRPPSVVTLRRAGDHHVIDIADHDPTVLPEYADARPMGAGGLGLRLARQLALEVGWYVTDDTKHVWAIFPV